MERKRRTIVKAISYRGLVTMILAAISWIFTNNNADQTAVITILYAIVATIGYYGHERLWNGIRWETNETSKGWMRYRLLVSSYRKNIATRSTL